MRRALWRSVASVGLGALVSIGIFGALNRRYPFPLDTIRRPASLVVADRTGTPLRIFLAADASWRMPVGLADVAPELQQAVVASEDQWLAWHPGINPLAILRAAYTNWRRGQVVSGGSTIPMQIARLAMPRPRTLHAKITEAFRALQLRWHYSTHELLEIYLNMAPYGGNVTGAGAAAAFYFGKSPAQLSLGEAALLAALPRAPRAYDPVRHPAGARAARDRVLHQLAARGVFEREAVREALREPLPAARRPPAMAAPHFTQLIATRHPAAARLVTTLDRHIQEIAESRVGAHITELRARGITNAAVVVIETPGRALRAMVGSAGFFEEALDGQVNASIARRSPGSALKPFLYALAFDGGRIIPDSYLLDVPTDFGGYVPENFDGQYRGRVTAREALVNSLNVPAVRLESEVGLEQFHHLLLRGGLSTLDRTPADYGLSLVLGSGEVTLLDLTNLYATLASGGVHRPPRLLVDADDVPETRLFSPESAAMTAEILTQLQRPDLPQIPQSAVHAPMVAWKTGTSYGHRDAWAIGFSQRYTVGVWVGNIDGRPVKGISGAANAAPLLFDLFHAIEPDGADLPQLDASRTDTVEVCAVSHELPGPFCHERVRVPFLPGRSRLAPCSYHRRIFVDAESGERLAGECLTRPHRAQVITTYPTELVGWWRSAGQSVEVEPRMRAGCSAESGDEAPRIVSPSAATPYRVRREAPARYQRIPLSARASASAGRLYWYADGVLVDATDPAGTLFLEPRAGNHRVVVVDANGRSDAVTYDVE